jgi:hypothetical protein
MAAAPSDEASALCGAAQKNRDLHGRDAELHSTRSANAGYPRHSWAGKPLIGSLTQTEG